jgi:NADH:ubiquinone oxidoreductase subunit 3 (subunit A)
VIVESIIAFVLILTAASVVYLLGRRVAPKPAQTDSQRSAYACGENVTFHGPQINVSLFKYLIYFVIFDSSVLLLAYASFTLASANPLFLILYLGIILAAGLVLLEGGGKEQ